MSARDPLAQTQIHIRLGGRELVGRGGLKAVMMGTIGKLDSLSTNRSAAVGIVDLKRIVENL